MFLNGLSSYDDICQVLPISIFFFGAKFRENVKNKIVKRNVLSQIPWSFFYIAKKNRVFELVSPDLEALLLWVAK